VRASHSPTRTANLGEPREAVIRRC
jgi:hypothetical protein